MASWDSTNSPVAVELETEVEGEHEGTTDFFFEKIGEGVPLKPHDSNFGPEPPPSQPLAVSERFRAVFIAYSSGFFVARTKDVIDSAKEIKEKGSGISIQQLSLVDVSIGNIHILAISTENSTLAASVAGDMHFFSVTSLLNKEVKKMFYCSLPESGYVKDMRWNTKSEDLFVVLSDSGKLYRGEVDTTLGEVMDNVDAVEWSVQGKLIAVARKNVLGFFSTKFKQKSSVLLSFKSWADGSEEKCTVRVDSIKWVRPDCIVLGCFKLTVDGTEEDYLLQVIRNRTGRITDASPKLVVQSFCDLYSGLIDDIVPFGSGPHLFLTYLEQWQLAITANRKNTDQHVVLLGWSVGDDKSEAAVIDIERDNWLPRIELQENGDDNVVLGLCIDRVSIYQKVSVQCGVEDRTEVSPHCILLCLTLEGRLFMFHVASIAGTKAPLEVISACTNEEEDTSLEFPLEDPSTFLPELEKQELEWISLGSKLEDVNKKETIPRGDSETAKKNDMQACKFNDTFLPGLGKQELEQISLGPKLKDLDTKETFPRRDSETSKKNDKQASKFNETLMSEPAPTPDHYQISHKKDIPRNWKVESLANLQPIATIAKLNQERDGQKLSASESTNLGLLSSEASPLEQPDFIAKHTSKIEIQKTEELASSPGSFEVKVPPSTICHTSHNNLQTSSDMIKESPVENGSSGSQAAAPHSWSGGTFSFRQDSNAKPSSSTSPSSWVQGSYENATNSFGATNAYGAGSVFGKPFAGKDKIGTLTTGDVTGRPVQSVGQRASLGSGNVESLPSLRSSQMSPQEIITVEKSSVHKFQPFKEHNKTPPMSAMLNTEPKLLKQFGNSNEMTRELDILLESIEEAGGYVDACTISLRSPIEELEQGMEILSEKSKTWRSLVDENLERIHCLLEKTVQVVARKAHVEGIVKQASDSCYWDLWNRQKLNSELEMKRKHIVQKNQEATNQLIELERHFNALELNKFGENSGGRIGQRALKSRNVPSRQAQSLHSLHNAISHQLTAADQLSEHLSKQMEALSVKSPFQGQKNVKKELFDTIGIPHDASFSSPDVKRIYDTPSSRNLLLSGSSISNDQSRRNQLSTMKSYETETARRRRDSLDQSWASFEPHKTIVKRRLLNEVQKATLNTTPFPMAEQNVGPCIQQELDFRPRDHTVPSTVVSESDKNGNQEKTSKDVSEHSESFIWANNLSGPTQSMELKSHFFKRSNASVVPSLPAKGKSRTGETQDLIAEKSNGVVKFNSGSDSVREVKHILQSETIIPLKSSTSLPFPSSCEMPISNSKDPVVTSYIMKTMDRPSSTVTSEFWKKHESSFSASSSVSAESLSGKVSTLDVANNKSHTGEKLSPVPPSIKSNEAPSLIINTSSAPLLSSLFSPSALLALSNSLTSANTNGEAIQTVPAFSTTAAPSSDSSLVAISEAPKRLVPSFTNSPSSSSTFEDPKSEVQPTSFTNLKTDLDAAKESGSLQVDPPRGEFKLKRESAAISGPSIESTTRQPATNVASSSPSMTLNSQSEQPTTAPVQLPTPFATAIGTGGRNGGLDIAISEEDEMEEEAPEMSDVTKLSLGSLGMFGTGSTPNPTTKSNPFGGSFSNTAANLTTTLSVPSGELFRPASFSFQSPMSSPPSQLTKSGPFSGGFSKAAVQTPSQNAFGQPSQIGSGQQALGSVLGTFGQSRQLGSGLSGSAFAAPSGFGGGFSSSSSTGGFSSVNSGGGGFAGVASGVGFAAVASGGVGFGGAAPGGFGGAASGGFAGAASGGFAGAASGGFAGAASGGFAGAASGGFAGAFSGQGSGGFGVFGKGGESGKPPELFTQIRK